MNSSYLITEDNLMDSISTAILQLKKIAILREKKWTKKPSRFETLVEVVEMMITSSPPPK